MWDFPPGLLGVCQGFGSHSCVGLPPRRGVTGGSPRAEGPKRLISISIKNRPDETGTHPIRQGMPQNCGRRFPFFPRRVYLRESRFRELGAAPRKAQLGSGSSSDWPKGCRREPTICQKFKRLISTAISSKLEELQSQLVEIIPKVRIYPVPRSYVADYCATKATLEPVNTPEAA